MLIRPISWWPYPGTTASAVNYTANALNQYMAVGAVTPSYNANGNLIGDGTFTYGYDVENRLTSANGAGNSASYAYDAQGRRKSKTVNGTTTIFVTDADNREILEYDGANGQLLRWYAYGLGSNDALNQMNVAAATRATFIPDIQGSIVGMVDGGSGTLSKAAYSPYGKSSAAGPFAYTGQRIDPETNGLHYYRARHYMPAWGRFMQPDPIGYAGGVNLYAYVGNDPVNLIDPFGLSRDSPQDGGSAFSPWALGTIDPNQFAQVGAVAAQTNAFLVPAITFSAPEPSEIFQLAANVLRPKGQSESILPELSGSGIYGTGAGARPGSSAGASPDFIVSPGGTAYPIPRGGTGPTPAETGRGFQFQGGSGGPGLNEGVTGFRFMEPRTTGPYQYPNGYGVYNNVTGQTVNPLTGRTIPNSDPWAHIPAR